MLVYLALSLATDVAVVAIPDGPVPISADVVGVDALLARIDASTSPPVQNARASELVQRGEELLLSFEHARAAALLGEAAALLEPTLSAVDFDTWVRARTLAGVAWMEAGNADAAKDAFTRLLALHPDVVPDASLLSPAARAAFDAARADVSARGTGTLKVGAVGGSIIVDGRPRGEGPLSIAGLVAGMHRVVVEIAGYEDAIADVEVRANDNVLKNFPMVPTQHRRTLASLAPEAVPAIVLPELRTIVVDAKLDALLVVHVDGGVVRIRRVTAAKEVEAVGAHVQHEPLATLDARVRSALATTASDVDFDVALLGRRTAKPFVAVAPPVEPETDWVLIGAVGGGSLVVVAAATAAVIALWPQPVPERTLSVALELPAP